MNNLLNFNFLTPVPPGTKRPRWSVMIPTYNCADYAVETITSVLKQDPGEDLMQIEVIDDGSHDNIAEVVQRVGKGRVAFFQQPANVGHIRNFETALSRSRGEYVHLLHGDDRVLWGFYAEMGSLLEQHPGAGAAFCRHYFMDATGDQHYISPLVANTSGVLANFLEHEARQNIIQTPAMVVRRKVYEVTGMFDKRLQHSEDWEMWVRIGAAYPVIYCKTPLAEYRNYDQSHTVFTTAQESAIEIEQLAQSIIREHAGSRVNSLKKSHMEYFVSNGWYNLLKLYKTGQRSAAIRILKQYLGFPLPAKGKLRLLKQMAVLEWQFQQHKKARKRK
ncbi:MAG: glycosyltransferase [Bacteroidota bacterium]